MEVGPRVSITSFVKPRAPRPFDERRFPCAPPYRDAYDRACRDGRAAMADRRVVFCGLARDVARELPDTIARIEAIGRRFADWRVVVFENDSVDRTLPILRAWERHESRVHVISESLGDRKWGPVRDTARTEQLAGYRNRVRDVVLDRHGDFDCWVVLDFDLHGFSEAGIANCFGHGPFDLMGANGLSLRGGRPIFYDTFAFRTLDRSEPCPNIETNLMVFPTGMPPMRVASCFGGLAIYDAEAMRRATYGGEDCEHVVLHRRMIDAGRDRLFLNPSLLVRYPDHQRLQQVGHSPDRPRWWIPRRKERAVSDPDPLAGSGAAAASVATPR